MDLLCTETYPNRKKHTTLVHISVVGGEQEIETMSLSFVDFQ